MTEWKNGHKMVHTCAFE